MATNTLCQGLPPVNCPFMANTPPRVTTRLLFMVTAKGSTTHFLEHYVLHTGLLGQYPLAHTLIGLEQLKSELLGKITCHLQDQTSLHWWGSGFEHLPDQGKRCIVLMGSLNETRMTDLRIQTN